MGGDHYKEDAQHIGKHALMHILDVAIRYANEYFDTIVYVKPEYISSAYL